MSKRALIDKKPLNRTFINTEEITFLQTDASGILISASEHLSSFTGLSIKDLVGSSLFQLIPKKDHPKLSSLLKKQKSALVENLTISIKGDKKHRPIQFSIHYLAGANNRNFLLNWTMDPKITSNRSRERSALQLVGQMFSENRQPVILYNPGDFQFAYANPAACATYGYNESEFLQLSITGLLKNNNVDHDTPLVSGKYFFSGKNGSNILTDVFISPVVVANKTFEILFLNTNLDAGFFQPVKSKQYLEASTPFDTEINNSELLRYSTPKNENFTDTREILDNSPTIFFKLDSKGNFLFVSDEFQRLLGYSCNEIFGLHFTSIVFPDDLDIAEQGFADIFQFGRAQSKVNFRALKKSGGFEWFSTSGIFVFDQNGKPLYCIGFAQNITEIKQLVEKLEASEERYAAFINHSSEAIWRFETAVPIPLDLPEEEIILEFFTKGYLAECNDQMAKLYGFEEAADIAGAPLTSFIPADDPGTQAYFKGFIQAGFKLVNVETHETDKNGNEKIFLNNLLGIVENKKLVRVWGTQRDVTEQRTAENKAKQQLEQSENFFKSLISDSLDGIIILDTEGVITYAAESIKNVLGFLPSEVIGKNCFEFIHREDLTTAQEAFDNSFTQLKSPYLEARFHSKKGEWLWMLVRSNNLYHQPSIRGMVVYFTNITQRKHTENILKESEKRFRNLADTVPVMVWVTDENNKSTYVSRCWSDFTGVSLEAIISSGWAKIIHPDDHQVAKGQYDRHMKSRQPFVIEYRIRSKEGDFKWVVDHGVPRFTTDGIFIGYIGSVIDIHYRKTAEQKLRYQAAMIENIRDAIISTD
ncbi:MAG: PAS domain S-box protein, partial [Flavitalea sp.]